MEDKVTTNCYIHNGEPRFKLYLPVNYIDKENLLY